MTEAVVYTDGAIVRKILVYKGDQSYEEADYNIQLTPEGLLIPASGKGNPRPFNFANLQRYNRLNFSFWAWATANDNRQDEYQINQGCGLMVWHRLMHCLLAQACHLPNGWDGIRHWADRFVQSRPADYLAFVARQQQSKPARIRYKPGDIIAFPFANGQFGFCRILLDINRLRKTSWLKDLHFGHDGQHHFNLIMATLILAEVFDIQKPHPALSDQEICTIKRFPAFFLADDFVRNGYLPIVAHQRVAPDHLMSLPESFATHYHYKPLGHSFHWGWAAIGLPCDDELTRIDNEAREQVGGNHAFVPLEAETYFFCFDQRFKRKAAGELYGAYDLRNPQNQAIRDRILSLLGLPSDMDYDAFCRHCGVPTRSELLAWQETGEL